MKAIAMSALVAGAAATAPLVKVTAFVESGCPNCQNFDVGGLNQTYHAAGVADIIDLDYTVFGNAYFATQPGCQNKVYDKTNGMNCWLKTCKGCGDSCDPSCFDGPILCQHGADECTGNVIENCAVHVAPSKKLVPFIVCMSKNVGDHCATCVKDAPTCAKEAGIDWTELNSCINNATLAQSLIVASAKKTANFGGGFTPWVIVDGTILGDVSTLKDTVCKAYTGTKPSGC
eukprot:Hpha_TRINITY_DN12022_c0_g1::TRINITY_DN12022_c0_g1_i1::g.140871::m.140871/K08059/IFI30, GILT; interferon, gamma-inducible protein 30